MIGARPRSPSRSPRSRRARPRESAPAAPPRGAPSRGAGTLVSILIPARNEAAQHRARRSMRRSPAGASRSRSSSWTTARPTRTAAIVRGACRARRARAPADRAGPAAGLDRQGACLPPPVAAAARARTCSSSMPTCASRPTPPRRWPATRRHSGAGLVSAVPRQEMRHARRGPDRADDQPAAPRLPAGAAACGCRRAPRLGAACGQLMLVEREPIAPPAAMPRIRGMSARRHAARPPAPRAPATAPISWPAHRLASCRMYRGFDEAWAGFLKNAREGMATPLGLPVWTVLLAGGHLCPSLLLPLLPAAWPASRRAALARRCAPPITLAHAREPVVDPAASGDRSRRAGDPMDRAAAHRQRPPGGLEGPRSTRPGEADAAPPRRRREATTGRELPGRLPAAGAARCARRFSPSTASCAWPTTSPTRPTRAGRRSSRASTRSRPRCSRATPRCRQRRASPRSTRDAAPASREARQLLRAFRQDAVKQRYADWDGAAGLLPPLRRPGRPLPPAAAWRGRARRGARRTRSAPPCRSSTTCRTSAATASALDRVYLPVPWLEHGRRRGGVLRARERGPAPRRCSMPRSTGPRP